MRRTDISNSDDIIDVRSIIARVEELEGERDAFEPDSHNPRNWADDNDEDARELATLSDLLEEMRGNGGDEQWRGDWYPGALIRASYFTEYAQQLADDIGAVKDDSGWPGRHIDWDAAADELKQDYTEVEFDGVSYWVR